MRFEKSISSSLLLIMIAINLLPTASSLTIYASEANNEDWKEVDTVDESNENLKEWNSSNGTQYYKNDIVKFENDKKIVVQDFTANGDSSWWQAPSLFANISNSENSYMTESNINYISSTIEKNEIPYLVGEHGEAILTPNTISFTEDDGTVVTIFQSGNDVLAEVNGEYMYLKEFSEIYTETFEYDDKKRAWVKTGGVYKTTNKEWVKVLTVAALAGGLYSVTATFGAAAIGTASTVVGGTATVGDFMYATLWGKRQQYYNSTCRGNYKNYTDWYKYNNYTGFSKSSSYTFDAWYPPC